jgi:hypothetical protein
MGTETAGHYSALLGLHGREMNGKQPWLAAPKRYRLAGAKACQAYYSAFRSDQRHSLGVSNRGLLFVFCSKPTITRSLVSCCGP